EQLDEMQDLLRTGPLVIGENHTQDSARVAVNKLIDRSAVKYLSLELPFCPKKWTSTGPIKQENIRDSFAEVKVAHDNPIPLDTLATNATVSGVHVYFHDRPKIPQIEQLRFQDSKYPNHVAGLVGIYTIPDFS